MGYPSCSYAPRPKTFRQDNNDRLHKWLVRVVCKKFSELVNVDIAYNFEEMRVVTNCFIGGNVIKLRGGGMREWIHGKRVLGSRTNGTIYSTLD